MIYDFKTSYSVAEIGEQQIAQWLRQKGYKVIDVSMDKQYQAQDIDFICTKLDKSGRTVAHTYEVKVDTYTSGNFFFETVSNDKKHTAGCLQYSNADYLLYYFTREEEIYIFQMWEIRKYIMNNMHRFSTKTCQNEFYRSEGLIVPKTIIESEIKPFKAKYGGV